MAGGVIVRFLDGTEVIASSLAQRADNEGRRDFGLYLDTAWRPTWPAEVVEWPDFGLPVATAGAMSQIRGAFTRAQAGERVEVGCRGGLGRTGTVLACMAVLSGVPGSEAVEWVRDHYDRHAVETAEQAQWVELFAESVEADGA